eukprot:2962981-Lingulodinium_polyedra.AAC.1
MMVREPRLRSTVHSQSDEQTINACLYRLLCAQQLNGGHKNRVCGRPFTHKVMNNPLMLAHAQNMPCATPH